ncbi:MAG: GNAT family N-acetyltransferase [Defluviitaleaceae bacterium]|nr:GNAT family N-acetyltransferase [Defluviitaleaceae bacterium]
MNIEIKHFPQKRICDEFFSVLAFLQHDAAKGYNKNWHWGRWEWLLSHPNLDEETLPSIGLVVSGEEIVGLVTHDMRKPAYLLRRDDVLLQQMLDYAETNFLSDGTCKIFVDEKDIALVSAVKSRGFNITEESEHTLILDCQKKFVYELSDKFSISDYQIDKDLDKYEAVIHKGFGNKGKPRIGLTEADFFEQPHHNHKLSVFVVVPGGEYAAHCGTWHSPGADICYVEPVVTIPEYRSQGLGKTVVYESINRCIELGAKKAIVISNQQFYYNIGFEQYSVCRLWEKKR